MSEFTPSRRSVIRTAAWTVPAVSVAAAAPAFAVSPPVGPAPNLSTSTLSEFQPLPIPADVTPVGVTPTAISRDGNVLTIPPLYIRNTGDLATTGVLFDFQSSAPISAINIHVPYGGPDGMTVPAGPPYSSAISPALPASDFSFVFLTSSNIAPGAAMAQVATLILTFADSAPVDLSIALSNGDSAAPGVPGSITITGA